MSSIWIWIILGVVIVALFVYAMWWNTNHPIEDEYEYDPGPPYIEDEWR